MPKKKEKDGKSRSKDTNPPMAILNKNIYTDDPTIIKKDKRHSSSRFNISSNRELRGKAMYVISYSMT